MGADLTRVTYPHGQRTWLWSIRVVLLELGFDCLIWVTLFTTLQLLSSLILIVMAQIHISLLTNGFLAYNLPSGRWWTGLSAWYTVLLLWHWVLHWFFLAIINLVLYKLIDFFLDILELEISEWIYAIASKYLIKTTHHHIHHRNQSRFQSLTSLSSPCRELLGIIRVFFASFRASRRIFGHDYGPRCSSVYQRVAILSSIPFQRA